MARTGIRPNGWMVEIMKEFLIRNIQATNEEIEYLKMLCEIRSKKCESSNSRPGSWRPSMIIDDFLYHGDFAHANNKSLLNELNIRHIINVCDFELEKEIVQNFNVLWIKIDDGLSINISQHFNATNQFLDVCKSKNEKVLVNCQMGISRSSSIVLAYLLKCHYETLADAYEHLVTRRRIAAPNLGFFIRLMRYEKELVNKQNIPNKENSTIPTIIAPDIKETK